MDLSKQQRYMTAYGGTTKVFLPPAQLFTPKFAIGDKVKFADNRRQNNHAQVVGYEIRYRLSGVGHHDNSTYAGSALTLDYDDSRKVGYVIPLDEDGWTPRMKFIAREFLALGIVLGIGLAVSSFVLVQAIQMLVK
jgi:hypothetical protein